MTQLVKTVCSGCNNFCGLDVTVDRGRNEIIKIEGTLDHPVNQGGLCPKGFALRKMPDDPERLLHPLKRKGERGEGKWDEICLDEAMDILSSKMKEIKEQYGAQAFCYWRGEGSGWESNWDYVQRFMNVYGSPNIASHGHICSAPRDLSNRSVYGIRGIPDYEHTDLIILWGSNPAYNLLAAVRRILDAKERGAKLVVIDTRFSPMAAHADLFVQPRPGTDGALALGIIQVLIAEDLYDKEFVDRWSIGFDDLHNLAEGYPPKRVEEITWVSSDLIREVARLYASSSPRACIVEGNGLDMHTNVVQMCRAISMIRALTGTLDKKGGEILSCPPPPYKDMHLREMLPQEPRPISTHPLFYELLFNTWPEVQHTLLTGQPYEIKGLFVQGGGLVTINANSPKVVGLVKGLDFLAVHDIYLTATAEIADLVIPAACFLEGTLLKQYKHLWRPDAYTNLIAIQNKCVEPPGECISDKDLIVMLARKLGYEEFFPWKDSEELINEELSPMGFTYEDLKRAGFHKVLLNNPDDLVEHYEKQGRFNTPSGKVEFYSRSFESYGYDSVPTYVEPAESPVSKKEMTDKFPLIASAGLKLGVRTHTRYQTLKSLNVLDPFPIVELHPETAKKLGIGEGEEVVVESQRGSILRKARITEATNPGVVFLTHGWGQPYGYLKSSPINKSVNILTDDEALDPECTAVGIRSFLCNVKKSNKEEGDGNE